MYAIAECEKKPSMGSRTVYILNGNTRCFYILFFHSDSDNIPIKLDSKENERLCVSENTMETSDGTSKKTYRKQTKTKAKKIPWSYAHSFNWMGNICFKCWTHGKFILLRIEILHFIDSAHAHIHTLGIKLFSRSSKCC